MQTEQKQLVIAAGFSASFFVIGSAFRLLFPDIVVPTGWSMALMTAGICGLIASVFFGWIWFVNQHPLEIRFVRIEKAAHIPDPHNSAIRLVIANRSQQRLDGLRGSLTKLHMAISGFSA